MLNFTMDDVPILYEDSHIMVVVKPQNMPSQEDASGDMDLLTLLKNHIKERDNKPGNVFLGLVHRLDRVTGGLMVFAKNSKSAARLSAAIAEREVHKSYLAVVLGEMKERSGTLVNYLKKHSATNQVYVATEATIGAKRAELSYKVLDSLGVISLLQIELKTGRSHQIRVQFASGGNPVFGDVRYGGDKLAKGHNLALWAARLDFYHPVTKENMVFVSYPPEEKEPWKKFNLFTYLDYFKRTSGIVLPSDLVEE